MVKKIVYWKCEVCCTRYDEKKDAEECQAEGKAEEYPIGLIHGDHTPDDTYSHITFAVATNELRGHMNVGGLWACRDGVHGDSLGENLCGSNSIHLNKYDAKLDFTASHLERMVVWLDKQGITPLVWDGKKAIPLSKTPYKGKRGKKKKTKARR